MIATPDQFPFPALQEQFGGTHRLTVAEYHTLIEHAVLTTEDKVELTNLSNRRRTSPMNFGGFGRWLSSNMPRGANRTRTRPCAN